MIDKDRKAYQKILSTLTLADLYREQVLVVTLKEKWQLFWKRVGYAAPTPEVARHIIHCRKQEQMIQEEIDRRYERQRQTSNPDHADHFEKGRP